MKISTDEQVRRGVYANLVIITHRREEFVLDFMYGMPLESDIDSESLILVSRVIVSPEHFKRLYKAIGEQVGKYEKHYGTIEVYGNEGQERE